MKESLDYERRPSTIAKKSVCVSSQEKSLKQKSYLDKKLTLPSEKKTILKTVCTVGKQDKHSSLFVVSHTEECKKMNIKIV